MNVTFPLEKWVSPYHHHRQRSPIYNRDRNNIPGQGCPVTIEIDGIVYPSMSQAAKHFDVSYHTISNAVYGTKGIFTDKHGTTHSIVRKGGARDIKK